MNSETQIEINCPDCQTILNQDSYCAVCDYYVTKEVFEVYMYGHEVNIYAVDFKGIAGAIEFYFHDGEDLQMFAESDSHCKISVVSMGLVQLYNLKLMQDIF